MVLATALLCVAMLAAPVFGQPGCSMVPVCKDCEFSGGTYYEIRGATTPEACKCVLQSAP